MVGSRETFSLMGAVVAMSHASNSFDIDDGHNLIKGHPGTSFIAGLLASALKQDVNYREFLTTLVIGYDVAVRSGLAIQQHYHYLHSTGAYGAVGTAACMGRILGLDEKQLNNALSIADFHAPFTPVMRAVEYPSMNKDGVPFGALVGATAVMETLAGSTGRTHLLEQPEAVPLLNTLGNRYEIMQLYFKPFTCCRWAHQPIQAGLTLMEQHGVKGKDIRSVTVHTFQAAARLSKIIPTETDEAQYNIAYPVAAAFVHGELGYLQVRNEALGDPRVLDMMNRLSFVVDPELEAQFPAKRLAWIEMELADGRTLTSAVCSAPGEVEDHVDAQWISQKFCHVTLPFLAPEGQKRVMELLLQGTLEMPVREVVSRINKEIRGSDAEPTS